jgi:hypothetical protein
LIASASIASTPRQFIITQKNPKKPGDHQERSMTHNHLNSHIQKCLFTSREKVLDLWASRLDQPEKSLLEHMMGDFRLTLSKYYEQITSSLTESMVIIPPLPTEPFDLDGARREVSILLEGKEVVMKFLREHLVISNKDRLLAHQRMTEIFHDLLRANSDSACDSCRHALDRLESKTATPSCDGECGCGGNCDHTRSHEPARPKELPKLH